MTDPLKILDEWQATAEEHLAIPNVTEVHGHGFVETKRQILTLSQSMRIALDTLTNISKLYRRPTDPLVPLGRTAMDYSYNAIKEIEAILNPEVRAIKFTNGSEIKFASSSLNSDAGQLKGVPMKTKASIDWDLHMKRLDVEKQEDWVGWIDKMPFLSFPSDWEVKVMPPFVGAFARMLIRKKGQKQTISVYLDCLERLGAWSGAYWEIYPANGDTLRFDIDDADGLIKGIEKALDEISG